MSEKYDAIVIGMGPSGIFLAYELIQLKKAKNILLIDQGKRVENRNCPIEKVGKCVKCQPYCNITSGFSGAGAFSQLVFSEPLDGYRVVLPFQPGYGLYPALPYCQRCKVDHLYRVW